MSRGLRAALFAATIFLSAALLFQIELVIGKVLLPWFGGAPAVWTTCLVFFQVVLLLGYLYAHSLAGLLTPRRQAATHVVLLVASLGLLAFLATRWPSPVTPGPAFRPRPGGETVADLLLILSVCVGLPFFVLSTTGPLLQDWSVRVRDAPPWRLYALSNAGSLLGLLTYPALVEPLLPVRVQARLWSALYLVFCLGVVLCSRTLRALPAPPASSSLPLPTPDPPRGDRALWTALPAGASALLLATTNQMCLDSAVIPLLWVLPLVLYLVSFILCFSSGSLYLRPLFIPLFVASLPPAIWALFKGVDLALRWQILIFSIALFSGCMVAHGELARLKPHPERLTAFYLRLAAGGALGGLLVALAAPNLFPSFWEFHASLLGVALLLVVALFRDPSLSERLTGPLRVLTVLLLVALAGCLAAEARESVKDSILTKRNFFGALRVLSGPEGNPPHPALKLRHGRIAHGFQFQEPELRDRPTTYYGEKSGVGLVIANHPRRGKGMRLGVVGLGVGTLAAWAGASDAVRFYEINPAVLELSSGPRPLFTFLRDSPAKVEVALGDARLSLESELRTGPQDFDVLALDAFTSDAIPVHLLTEEAFAIYLAHLRRPDGVLAVHISNRYVDLVPIVASLARRFRLDSVLVQAEGDDEGGWRSDWVLLSPDGTALWQPAIRAAVTPWEETTASRPLRPWTDDYSNLISVLRF